MNEDTKTVLYLVQKAHHVVILQADNPDADSLGSALALEHILGDAGKQVSMYCAVDTPSYLKYLDGWSRVDNQLPGDFDLTIIVDASTRSLFEALNNTNFAAKLSSRPAIVLDHHGSVENPIDFAAITICDPTKSSTGELIYSLFVNSELPISVPAQECIMTSILGDTQGLTNQLASSGTYSVMSEMVASGVNRPLLEEKRRQYSKMSLETLRFKGELLARAKFVSDDKIAYLTITQTEITKYSPQYNPGPLVQPDLLNTEGVEVAIVFKTYDDGRITAAIRSNNASPIAASIATHMGGGGHDYASGFKITDPQDQQSTINKCIEFAIQELERISQ